MSNAIFKLLRPSSVAVIGASADAKKTSGRPVAYLRKHGFSGHIMPVNPKVEQIDGLPCYPDIASLPEVPDVAVVLLGAEKAHLAVKELSDRGCAAAIVLASGYTETGETGAQRQQQLIDAAGSMRLLGPNTIGLVNLPDKIVLSPSGALEMDDFPVGSIGVVSQSGGILGSLLSRAAARGVGLSALVSTSNEVDLELADFIDYFADDPTTKVIALYMETVRDAAKFRAACLKAARNGKPVVAFKVGRSEAGAQAAVSHTGAMAGADKMYDALFQQVGVIRASTLDDLLAIPAALSTGRRLHGRRVAILTSTGGAGTLVSDDLGVADFETPAPDEATASALRALQTGSEAVLDRNPIDVTLAGLRPDLLRGAITALLSSPNYDALVIIVGSSSLAMPELMVDAVQACLPYSDKPILAYVSPHAPGIAALLTRHGVPAYSSAEGCTAALSGMYRISTFRPHVGTVVESVADASIGSISAGTLDEAQSKALFSRFGIPCAPERVVESPEAAEAAAVELGGKVALKILSTEITHKSDVGGVAVGLTPETIASHYHQIVEKVEASTGIAPKRFLVQKMISGAIELILGTHRDSLGIAVLLGMGGEAAELFKDTTMRLLPHDGVRFGVLSEDDAVSMARELNIWPLLDGFRGKPKADVAALVAAIVNFSRMAAQLGDRLVEAEINPIFVSPQGQGVCAADGVVVLT